VQPSAFRTPAAAAALFASLLLANPAAAGAADAAAPAPQQPAGPPAPAARPPESWPFERGAAGRPGALVHDPLTPPFLFSWQKEFAPDVSLPALAVRDLFIFVAKDARTVTAVVPATGDPVWKHVSAEKISAGPVADETSLYYVDVDERLVAVSLASGQKTAELRLKHEGDGYDVEGTPGVADGDVVFGSTSFFLPWKSARVFRVSPAKGLAFAAGGEWPVKVGNNTLYGVGAAGGRVFLGIRGGRVLGFELATGRKLFSVEVDGDARMAPAVDGSLVLFVTDGNVLQALNHQGAPLWSKRFGAKASGPALVGDRIFVAEGKRLHAFARDGRELWTAEQPLPIIGNPAVTADAVVIAMGEGNVLWLKPADGSEVWRFRFTKRAIGSPLLYRDRLFVFDEQKQLHCFVDYGHVAQPEERRRLLALLLEATLDKRQSLEQIGLTGADAIPALLRAVQRRDWELQGRAVDWLVANGAAAVPEIVASPLLSTGTVEQQTYLLAALGRIGDPKGLPAVAELVKKRGDTHAAASAAAAAILPNLAFPPHESLLESVRVVFIDGTPAASAAAAAAFERAGAAAVPTVMGAFAIKEQREKSGAVMRRMAASPQPCAALQEQLLDLAETTTNHELGVSAIALLGEIGDRDALEPLAKLAPQYPPASGSCMSSGPSVSPATAAADKIKARFP
jgi:outer membrane protein assembly factor BamB